MKVTGTAHQVGDHIDTDAIIPARFLVTTDSEELGRNCMSGLEEGWVDRVKENDIIVAGENFGCGSSREHAPISILGAGIPVVVAKSFARIFYRNGFNKGLVLLEVGDDIDKLGDGQQITVDTEKGEITNNATGDVVKCAPVPPFMQGILDAGGLVEYARKKLAG